MRKKQFCSFLQTIFILRTCIHAYNTEGIEKWNQNTRMEFPKNFSIGVSSSSYQIEGGWNETGKGVNIWDQFVHTQPEKVKNRSNGDVACDSYHLYQQDISLLSSNNPPNTTQFDNYRFSISWSRILPTGEIDKISKIGIDYYHKLIDGLLKNGIQPMITIYHWDLPQRLQDIGGWANPLIVDYVEDYANILFEQYGSKVKWWITINEPTIVDLGYHSGYPIAPALNFSSIRYVVSHNLIRAHGKIFQLYHKQYRVKQKGKIGIALLSPFYTGKTNSLEDAEAAKRLFEFLFGLYANPIFTDEGDYPKIVREIVDMRSKEEGGRRSRLPKFTQEEKKYLKGSSDFFGLNHYSTLLCTPAGFSPNTPISEQDWNVIWSVDPSWPNTPVSFIKVVPWGMRELLKYIKNTYNNPPVFILENGFPDDGKINDTERISYHYDYLAEVWNAMNNHGCNVIGYNVWSFLDGFEWESGYTVKFGLVHVDFDDPGRKRTPKQSYYFFKKFLTSRILPDVSKVQ